MKMIHSVGTKRVVAGLGVFFCLLATHAFAGDTLRRIPGTPISVVVDDLGNKYISGTFSGINVNFNPSGAGGVLAGNGGSDVFVMRLNADGSFGWVQECSGTLADNASQLIVANGIVYVTYTTSSADLRIGAGASQAVPNGGNADSNEDGVVVALNATTGAPVTAFGGDGMVFICGAGKVFATGVAIQSTTLYVSGEYEGATVKIDNIGTGVSQIGTSISCAYVAALNIADGLPQNVFSADGLQTFGGNSSVIHNGRTRGTAIGVSGTSILLAGNIDAENAGFGANGVFNSFPSKQTDAFVTALDLTGAAVSGFGSGGVTIFGGSGSDTVEKISVGSSGSYLLGNLGSFDAGFNGQGGPFSRKGPSQDVFVLSLGFATFNGSPLLQMHSNVFMFAGGITSGDAGLIFNGIGEGISARVGDSPEVPLIDYDAVVSFPGAFGDGILRFTGSDSELIYDLGTFRNNIIMIGESFSANAGFEQFGTFDFSTGGSGFIAEVAATKDTIKGVPFGLDQTNSIAVDEQGNRYFAGTFTGIVDFNLLPGSDVRGSRKSDAFVTRINADGTYGWTRTFGSAGEDVAHSVVVANGVVHIAGQFSGAGAGLDGLGTIANLGSNDAFIAAFNSSDGSTLTAFGNNGVVVVAGTGNDFVSQLAVSGTTLFAAGTAATNLNVRIFSQTTSAAFITKGLNDNFIVALGSSTGTPAPTFGTSGYQVIGGTNVDSLSGMTLSADGASVYLSGSVNGNNIGIGALTGINSPPGIGFIARLDAQTGLGVAAFSTDGLVLDGTGANSLARAGQSLFTTTSVGIAAFDALSGAPVASFGASGVLATGSFAPEDVFSDGTLLFAHGFLDLAGSPLAGGLIFNQGNNDAIVASINPSTGTLNTSFGLQGYVQFSGSDADAIRTAHLKNGRLLLAGESYSSDVGFYGLGEISFIVTTDDEFLLELSATTGRRDLIVRNVNDSGPNSLREIMRIAANGDTVAFDSVVFDLSNSDAATVINVLSALPPLDDGSVTIDAKDRRVTVNGANSGASGFTIVSDGNAIQGLSIIDFPGSGVAILGSGGNRPKNNILGGNRTQGTGPNGQGLRIGNSGAFGIAISAADSNTVKGCWLGLDRSGLASQENLAGILIQAGAKNNVIGSTVAGEMNVISANSFEGITVSDSGSDGTIIIGNVIGASAVEGVAARSVESRAADGLINGRANAANGASGIFLSKGTQANSVGGTNAGEDNTVGFNGGSGIEVRAVASRKNSSKSNRIARNKNGGIKLFDGSNNNISAPTFDGVDRLPTRFARAVNATVRVRGSATSPDGSVVEVFRDRGDQGEQLIGRANCAAGKWQVEGDLLPDDNVTATVTDLDGNTSAFALFGPVPDTTSGTPVITGTLAIQATVGVTLNYRIAATGTPTDYDALSLPAGLSVNNSTGVISGTPTVSGTFSVDLAASNANGTGAAALTLTIGALPAGSPLIQNPLSATGLVGGSFSFTITIASGASNPVFAAANLPPGLSLDTATGVVSGTPTSAGVFAVLVSASNSLGQSSTTATFTILAGISSSADSDGDGVSDALEMLAQTDSLDASSKPTVAAQALGVSKTTLGLSFTSAKDKLKTVLSASSSAPVTSVGVLIGGVFERVSLDAKGKGISGAVAISAKGKNGVLAVTVSIANTDLEPALGALGFSNRTTTGKFEAIALPVALQIVTANGSTVQQGQATLNYKAMAGKTGKASQAK